MPEGELVNRTLITLSSVLVVIGIVQLVIATTLISRLIAIALIVSYIVLIVVSVRSARRGRTGQDPAVGESSDAPR